MHQHGEHACLHPGFLAFAVVQLGYGHKLDAVAELTGHGYVAAVHAAYALHMHAGKRIVQAKGQADKQDELVGRVKAVYVQRGIRLGIAKLLGLGKCRCKIQMIGCHF